MKLCSEAYVQVKKTSVTSAKCFRIKKDMLCLYSFLNWLSLWHKWIQGALAEDKGDKVAASYCTGRVQSLQWKGTKTPSSTGGKYRIDLHCMIKVKHVSGNCPGQECFLDLSFKQLFDIPAHILLLYKTASQSSLRRANQNLFNSIEGPSKLYRKLTQYLL